MGIEAAASMDASPTNPNSTTPVNHVSSTSKPVPRGIDVTQDCCQTTCHGYPDTELVCRDTDSRQYPLRHKPRRNPALTDVNDQDPEGEGFALRPQRIRTPGIPAAQRTDINTPAQSSDDQASDYRAEQVTEERLDDKLTHVGVPTGRKTSASMQRTLPPPNRSMVGTGTDSM
jgi:hypothetical protein